MKSLGRGGGNCLNPVPAPCQLHVLLTGTRPLMVLRSRAESYVYKEGGKMVAQITERVHTQVRLLCPVALTFVFDGCHHSWPSLCTLSASVVAPAAEAPLSVLPQSATAAPRYLRVHSDAGASLRWCFLGAICLCSGWNYLLTIPRICKARILLTEQSSQSPGVTFFTPTTLSLNTTVALQQRPK